MRVVEDAATGARTAHAVVLPSRGAHVNRAGLAYAVVYAKVRSVGADLMASPWSGSSLPWETAGQCGDDQYLDTSGGGSEEIVVASQGEHPSELDFSELDDGGGGGEAASGCGRWVRLCALLVCTAMPIEGSV